MAVGGLELARDQLDERGFARTGMTDQKHEFARVDLQRDIMQRRLVRLRGIHLGHVIERDDRRSDGLLLHLFDRNRRKGRGKIGRTPVWAGRFAWAPCAGACCCATACMAPVACGRRSAPWRRAWRQAAQHRERGPHGGPGAQKTPYRRRRLREQDAAHRWCSSLNAPFKS